MVTSTTTPPALENKMTIAAYETKLRELIQRFNELGEKSQCEYVDEAARDKLQAEQMVLLMTSIPEVRARLRLLLEKSGALNCEYASIPKFTLRGSDEHGWEQTLSTYIVGNDMYWNSSPMVVGKGPNPRDALTDFWIGWREMSFHRHGRNVKLVEVGKSAYENMINRIQGDV